ELERRAGGHEYWRPHGLFDAVDAKWHRRAGDRNPCAGMEAQGRPEQRDLQCARIDGVAAQRIRDSPRGVVERARAADAEVREAAPTGILERGQQPRLDDFDGHPPCSARRANSSAPMTRNRTPSPGACSTGSRPRRYGKPGAKPSIATE